MHTCDGAVRTAYIFPLSRTEFTAPVKCPLCFPCVACTILSVNTSFFKSCHFVYLPFLVAVQPANPINVMTRPKMTKSIACVRLIVFKSVLPAVPMMMKSPTETTHLKNVFISILLSWGKSPKRKHPKDLVSLGCFVSGFMQVCVLLGRLRRSRLHLCWRGRFQSYRPAQSYQRKD